MDSLVPLQQHIVSPATFFICEKLQEGVTQTEYTSNEVLFIKQRLKLYPAFNEFCYFPYQSITPILSCDWQAMQRSEKSKDLDFSCSNFSFHHFSCVCPSATPWIPLRRDRQEVFDTQIFFERGRSKQVLTLFPDYTLYDLVHLKHTEALALTL